MVSMPEETMKKVMGSQNSHNFVVGSVFFSVVFQSLLLFSLFRFWAHKMVSCFCLFEQNVYTATQKSNAIARSHSLLKMKTIFEDRLVLFRCWCVSVYVGLRAEHKIIFTASVHEQREMKINEKRKNANLKAIADRMRNVCLSPPLFLRIYSFASDHTSSFRGSSVRLAHSNRTIPTETLINSIGILMKFTVLHLASAVVVVVAIIICLFLLPISLA